MKPLVLDTFGPALWVMIIATLVLTFIPSTAVILAVDPGRLPTALLISAVAAVVLLLFFLTQTANRLVLDGDDLTVERFVGKPHQYKVPENKFSIDGRTSWLPLELKVRGAPGTQTHFMVFPLEETNPLLDRLIRFDD